MFSSIEIANSSAVRGTFRFALFDFDGTLSLIREGWMDVMIPYFVEELLSTPDHESAEQIERVVRDFVETLTGKQTIYQCFQLQEEIQKRGGIPTEALHYKHEYLARLNRRIDHRLSGLANGKIEPDSLCIGGSRSFLEALRQNGCTLYLASGTDLQYVQAELEALELDHFFGKHVYGALDNYKEFSKRMIIDRIVTENGLAGTELLVVGDGYVEIENGKSAGGYSLGVASDEAHAGAIDQWKRTRLLSAGADAIIADYTHLKELIPFLFQAPN